MRVVVVVVVGGKEFDDKLLDTLLSGPPILNFLRGGIRGNQIYTGFSQGRRTRKECSSPPESTMYAF